MGERLISDAYMRFCMAIGDNVSDLDEMILTIGQALDSLNEIMHIGRMDMEIEAPVTDMDREGLNRAITMYASRYGFSNDPIEEFFVGSDIGTMTITVFPEEGVVWDVDAQKDIRLLTKTIYIVCGRARLLGILKKASMTDKMTGIANHDGMLQFGGMLTATRRLPEYAGLFLNIKGFKVVNDRFGTTKADMALRNYAKTLNDYMESDEMLARLGGDNFFALLRKERIEDFLTFLTVVSVKVLDETGTEETELALSTRAGIYMIDVQDTITDVLNCSSIALNIAKASEKDNHIWFKPHMLERLMEDKTISSLFPKALKNMEFLVYYQPKVELDTFKMCGCEALVRWYRDGKLVSPTDFIALLESEGSIRDLDFYVFQKVCQDIRNWQDHGIDPVRVSANFSKIHLKNPNFGRDILTVLNQYDIDPQNIEIEFTETTGYDDFEALKNFVDYMNKNGVISSLDDFGTGYSSINLLKDLDVSVIKLDKSFMDNLSGNGVVDEVMLRNVVKMIKDLGKEVLAEGVEMDEQVAFLKNIGCDMIQGYYFDRPLEQELFEEKLMQKDTVYAV